MDDAAIIYSLPEPARTLMKKALASRLPEPAEDLLTVPEGAALLRVQASWLYEKTRKDAVPLVRLGKYVRLPKLKLLLWVERGCPAQWRECLGAEVAKQGVDHE